LTVWLYQEGRPVVREIERKFFFNPALWTGVSQRTTAIEQGYLPGTGDWEIRLRRSEGNHRYTMKTGTGLNRGEWEVTISAKDFEALWPKTEGHRIEKLRDRFPWKQHTVEVDRYGGTLQGLTVAEVEFVDAAASRVFRIPRAFGPELTYDPRFKNSSLSEGRILVPRTSPQVSPAGWSFGVLPFRKGSRGWELVIVTTRRQDRWIFPKGQPEAGQTPEKVALAEAREEAGVSGKIAGHPIVLPYIRETGTTNLLLYPMLVSSLADRWLELGQRDRKVIPIAEAEAHGELVRLGAQWLQDFKGTVGS